MRERIAPFLLRLTTFWPLLGFLHLQLTPLAFFRSMESLFPYLDVIKRMHVFISLILRRLRVVCRLFYQLGKLTSIDA